MNETVTTLLRLREMRERSVSKLTTELAKQRQLCQRYQQNIQALTTLNGSVQASSATNAALLCNGSNYKNHIQWVIDWQKQEYALADKAAQGVQNDLIHEARREKTVDVVLQAQQSALRLEDERRQQKITDGLSAQAWLRNRKTN